MAQGKFKNKNKLPTGVKQKSGHRKVQQPKKGTQVFKPKKAKRIEEAKIKTAIDKTLRKSAEQQIVARASVVECRNLQVVKSKVQKSVKKSKKSAS